MEGRRSRRSKYFQKQHLKNFFHIIKVMYVTYRNFKKYRHILRRKLYNLSSDLRKLTTINLKLYLFPGIFFISLYFLVQQKCI